MSDRPAATRDDWRVLPMPARRSLPVASTLTRSQRETVELGLVPEAMEDKWFVFVEAGRLHCVRSWTGFTIFEATLASTPDGCTALADATANADPEQFRVDDPAEAARMLESLVRNLAGSVIDRSGR